MADNIRRKLKFVEIDGKKYEKVKGLSYDTNRKKWRVDVKGKFIGRYKTHNSAVRQLNKAINFGVDVDNEAEIDKNFTEQHSLFETENIKIKEASIPSFSPSHIMDDDGNQLNEQYKLIEDAHSAKLIVMLICFSIVLLILLYAVKAVN